VQDNISLISLLCSILHQPIWAGARSNKFTGWLTDLAGPKHRHHPYAINHPTHELKAPKWVGDMAYAFVFSVPKKLEPKYVSRTDITENFSFDSSTSVSVPNRIDLTLEKIAKQHNFRVKQECIDDWMDYWGWRWIGLEGLCDYILKIWEGYIEICLKLYWSIVLLLHFVFLVNSLF
jgi:hypothetical protein